MNTPSSPNHPPLLGVNIDHVATLRQARGVAYPDLIEAVRICEQAGADGITLHLREDRRHIQDADVFALANTIQTRMNLEMAATAEMITIAQNVQPAWVCLVPEKRQELTTEGGLDVLSQQNALKNDIQTLQQAGIQVSLFIDPDANQIQAAIDCSANAIELHTGNYAHASLANDLTQTQHELERIQNAIITAKQLAPTLLINAGHGLTRHNVAPIARFEHLHELNIGHAIIADAIFFGLANAVKMMKQAMGWQI